MKKDFTEIVAKLEHDKNLIDYTIRVIETLNSSKEQEIKKDEYGDYMKDENGWFIYTVTESEYNDFIDNIIEKILGKK